MTDDAEFSDLSFGAKAAVVGAVVFALAGLLGGLAGLLLSGILLFDVLFPGSGGAVAASTSVVVTNFLAMLVIATLGFLNLMLVSRWEAFLAGGWKRYVAQSLVCVVAVFALTSIANVFL